MTLEISKLTELPLVDLVRSSAQLRGGLKIGIYYLTQITLITIFTAFTRAATPSSRRTARGTVGCNKFVHPPARALAGQIIRIFRAAVPGLRTC